MAYSDIALNPLSIVIDDENCGRDFTKHCAVCSEPLGIPRSDGLVEKAAILPCSHIFGSLCISRWLDTESSNQNCPVCRRTMVYRECGHVVKPCDVSRAPKCVDETEMLENCFGCRAVGELREVLLFLEERWKAEEKVLKSLRLYVSGSIQEMCTSTPMEVDERLDDLREQWKNAAEAACKHFEEKEGGRTQW